jgi:hypothetical protein
VPPFPGPPGLVLIPESGAPVLGVVALFGAVGVLVVVVASVSVTVVVGSVVVVVETRVAEPPADELLLPELLEPQAARSSDAMMVASAAIRLIARMIPKSADGNGNFPRKLR